MTTSTSWRAARLVCAALLLTGCAAQLNGAAVWDLDHQVLKPAASFDLKFVQMRGSGPVIGLHLPVVSEGEGSPVVLRAAVLQLGGRWRAHDRLGIEGTIDFGLGGPIVRQYQGAGVYAGMELALALRLFEIGGSDHEPAFSTGYITTDLVLTGRAGLWNAPVVTEDWVGGEMMLELGLRFMFGTDLLSTQRWQESR